MKPSEDDDDSAVMPAIIKSMSVPVLPPSCNWYLSQILAVSSSRQMAAYCGNNSVVLYSCISGTVLRTLCMGFTRSSLSLQPL
jgi:hypothetical protein